MRRRTAGSSASVAGSASSAGGTSGSTAITRSSAQASGVVVVTSSRNPGMPASALDDVADAVDHVLRVVEHDQRRRTAERLPQVGREALRGHVGQPDARRELRGDLLVGADRRELDPGDAAVDRRSGGARGLDREPRLAGAAGPGQGDDPDRGVGQRGEDRGEVGDAAHERVGWRTRRGRRERRRGRGLGVLGPGSRGHDG